MINIEKGGTRYTVSKDAYEIYFKSIGFKKVPDRKFEEKKVEVEEPEIKNNSRIGKKDLKVGDKK